MEKSESLYKGTFNNNDDDDDGGGGGGDRMINAATSTDEVGYEAALSPDSSKEVDISASVRKLLPQEEGEEEEEEKPTEPEAALATEEKQPGEDEEAAAKETAPAAESPTATATESEAAKAAAAESVDVKDDKNDDKPGELLLTTPPVRQRSAGASLLPSMFNTQGPPTPDADLHVTYQDHFSLRTPSSTVHYRGAKVMVYEQANDQFLLETRTITSGNNKDNDDIPTTKITVKRMRAGTFGLRCLRTIYTLVSLLMTGMLWVFCFQLILMIFMNLLVLGGGTTGDGLQIVPLLGSVLSIPLFLHAMGSIMALGIAFTGDNWNGHLLLRSLLGHHADSVAVEWISFAGFIGIPILALCLFLFMKDDKWWEYGSMVWMVCVFALFIMFCALVAYRELQACVDLVRLHVVPSNETKLLPILKQVFLLTQTQRFAGTKREKYLVRGNEQYFSHEDTKPIKTSMGLYSRISMLCKCCFHVLEQPERRYSIEEIREIVPFVTKESWSLEKMFCHHKYSRLIYAVGGDDALTQGQTYSSLVCTIMGLILLVLFIVSLLLWFGGNSTAIIIVVIICLFCCIIPVMSNMVHLYRTFETVDQVQKQKLKRQQGFRGDGFLVQADQGDDPNREGGADGQDSTVYLVWLTYTVSKPKPWYCWVRLTLAIGLCFLWPIVTLIQTSFRLGILFLILGFFSFWRLYFDAGWVLSELGAINSIDEQIQAKYKQHVETAGSADAAEMGHLPMSSDAKLFATPASQLATREEQKLALLAHARTSEVMGKVTRSKASVRWMWVFGVFALAILGMSLMAANEDYSPQGGRPPIVLLDDFYYPPQPDLPYPTCRVAKGVSFPASQEGLEGPSLVDYSFAAALSYETPAIAQFHFNKWFGGDNIVVDEAAYVRQYRNATNTTDHPVFFKLLTFPSQPGVGVVAIRGSQTKADFLVDAQLWSGAALTQLVRAFIPFGWIWNPILDDLVTVVNFIESDRLKELSYYKVTSRFINDLLDNNYTGVTAASGGQPEQFTQLSVTGASLGGGIAIISGAQTRANAIAISGINAVLSRHSFSPPLSMQALNDQTFNLIPDRDIVAHVGDQARLYQRLQCRAPASSLFGCHSMWRSVCEISYVCGTQELDRPVLCRCVQNFGYPEPLPKPGRLSNLTFAERCALVTQETPV